MERKEHALLFVSDDDAIRTNPLMEALSRRHRCSRCTVASFGEIRGGAAANWLGIVIDADLQDALVIEQLKKGALHLDRNATFIVVIVDPYGLIDMKMAMILKADRVVQRMLVNEKLLTSSLQSRAVFETAQADYIRSGLEAIDWLVLKFSQPKTLSLALNAGETALDAVFQLAKAKTPLNQSRMAQQSGVIASALDEHGLQKWLDTVRQHHDATYRHSLAVAGIAEMFGKAEVPVEILEKDTDLTDRETAILRQHPMRGRQMVEKQKGIDPDVLDVISGHHEYLDGSGYPQGLKGDQIGDMTRLMTICDRFAYLISRHPPQVPHSNHEAFVVLRGMSEELDPALVLAFREVIHKLDREQELQGASAQSF